MELKMQLVGNLLDLLKFGYEETDKLSAVGVQVESFNLLEEKVWESIKSVVGMPEEQKNAFASDYWYGFAYDYTEGKISKEDATNAIVNWEETCKMLERKRTNE